MACAEKVVGPLHEECVSQRASAKGNYTSVTLSVWVENPDQVGGGAWVGGRVLWHAFLRGALRLRAWWGPSYASRPCPLNCRASCAAGHRDLRAHEGGQAAAVLLLGSRPGPRFRRLSSRLAQCLYKQLWDAFQCSRRASSKVPALRLWHRALCLPAVLYMSSLAFPPCMWFSVAA